MGDAQRATLALIAQALFWVLGTPGLDYLSYLNLRDEGARARMAKDLGGAAGLAFAIDDLERSFRRPIVELLAPVQRPFRISQEWNLYRDGPSRYVLLEVRLDGVLAFRTADPEHAWLAPQLRNRHVRPVVESTANKRDAPNWRGLTRYIVARARAENPALREVELLSRAGPFPGEVLTDGHRIVAKAPSWSPVQR